MALKTGFCGLGVGVGAAAGAPSGFGGSAIFGLSSFRMSFLLSDENSGLLEYHMDEKPRESLEHTYSTLPMICMEIRAWLFQGFSSPRRQRLDSRNGQKSPRPWVDAEPGQDPFTGHIFLCRVVLRLVSQSMFLLSGQTQQQQQTFDSLHAM
jgi:hypothetical protein